MSKSRDLLLKTHWLFIPTRWADGATSPTLSDRMGNRPSLSCSEALPTGGLVVFNLRSDGLQPTSDGLPPGGKACGQASVMLHWDDDSPIRRAMTGYVQGRRATPEKPSPPAPSCPQRCIYGICELGSCKCWKGAAQYTVGDYLNTISI